jgi:hypothetical protein
MLQTAAMRGFGHIRQSSGNWLFAQFPEFRPVYSPKPSSNMMGENINCTFTRSVQFIRLLRLVTKSLIAGGRNSD